LLVRGYTVAKLHDLFPESSNQQPDLDNPATVATLEEIEDKVLSLNPSNDMQHWLQTQALQLTAAMIGARWELVEQSVGQTPFGGMIVLLLFLFAIIFGSFGLFAPSNMTAISAIFVCAIGVGIAIRMTTELHIPFQGLIRISSAPLTHALDELEPSGTAPTRPEPTSLERLLMVGR
jgi:hypothetical protein